MLKRMFVLTFACALLLPALALAQDEGRPEGGGQDGRPGGMRGGQGPMGRMGEPKEHPFLSGLYLKMLEKRLDLTPAQKTKAQAAIDESREALKAKFDALKKLREEMKAIEKTINDKIKSSLTDEQRPAFEQIAKGPGGMGGGPQGGRRPQGGGRGGRGGPGGEGRPEPGGPGGGE